MPGLDQQTAISIVEVQQLVTAWARELDANGGLDIARLLAEDCNYLMGGKAYCGHAAVSKFYIDRVERIRQQQKDGVRTQRHTLSNLLVTIDGASHAKVTFTIVNYSAAGKPPVLNLVGPTMVADCRMECRREADGRWRIALFDNTPVFIGNDPFLNATVVQPQT
jgi:ketosteroid isomerase-like protein